MSKMSTEAVPEKVGTGFPSGHAPQHRVLNGVTMGTRWSAIVHASDCISEQALAARLQSAVDRVDQEMSTWKPNSDLNRINTAPVGIWVDVPQDLFDIIGLSLHLNELTKGAFDITVGRSVGRWGFGALAGQGLVTVSQPLGRTFAASLPTLERDAVNRRIRKHADIQIDLSGIAKGFGVDRLAETARDMAIESGLFSLDGELRALGRKPDGSGWAIGIEAPDTATRAAQSVIELTNAAVATSGTYRHCREVGGKPVHHTIDPRTGAPSASGIVSATVMAPTTTMADALATALLVSGQSLAEELSERLRLGYVLTDADGTTATNLGTIETMD